MTLLLLPVIQAITLMSAYILQSLKNFIALFYSESIARWAHNIEYKVLDTSHTLFANNYNKLYYIIYVE